MFRRVFGGKDYSSGKDVNRLLPLVEEINALEEKFRGLSSEELRAKTGEFKTRIHEMMTRLQDEVNQTRRALLEERRSEAEAANDFQQREASRECRSLEAQLKKHEDELKAAEKRVLDEILPEAFAAVREAAKRTIGQRHNDVQLIGGIVLHYGKIAEIRPGEGTPLVATCPLYLNSLTGQGSHLMMFNNYVAHRDAYWMGPIYHALGVSMASIYPMQSADEPTPARLFDPTYDSGDKVWKHFKPISRKEAYQADITYGTIAEFSFDYLRDNMVIDLRQTVQRELRYTIVDEIDNFLIDQARNPISITGPAEDTGDLYKALDSVVRRLSVKVFSHEPITYSEKEEKDSFRNRFDYFAFEKEHSVEPNPSGQAKIALAFGMKAGELFGGETEEQTQLTFEQSKKRKDILSVFRKAMQAHSVYQRDRDYVVNDAGEVIVIDELSGRLMPGRRYPDGLHQAVEAKENVKIQRESLTYATITIQSYISMYSKVAGATATAMTNAQDFIDIYNLEVVAIPTHRPVIREDFADRVYKDENAKFKAVVCEIEDCFNKQQPVLVGTVSIEKSEKLADLLKRKGIPFRILNAKEHQKEDEIIANAGRPSAVTVTTNMAGRGVDIVLGGKEPRPEDFENQAAFEKAQQNWETDNGRVLALGGLHVIGTERHKARRIDNQLRWRSGRQGDTGSSRFYVALDDDIIKRSGGDRIKAIMNWVGIDENALINDGMVSKSIEGSYVKYEDQQSNTLKHLLKLDAVLNKQREIIYAERRKVLSGADLRSNVLQMVVQQIKSFISERIGNRTADLWDLDGLLSDLNGILPLPKDLTAASLANLDPAGIQNKLIEVSGQAYDLKEQQAGPDEMRMLERLVMIKAMDELWVEHQTNMENQRQQANFAGLQQMKVSEAYMRIGGEQWEILKSAIREEVALLIFHVSIRKEESRTVATPVPKAAENPNQSVYQMPRIAGRKIGRNDPCYCGSGKLYKHCHGK